MRPSLVSMLQGVHFRVIQRHGLQAWAEEAVECGYACCTACVVKTVMNINLPHSLLKFLVDEERFEDAAYLRDRADEYKNKLAVGKCSYNENNYRGL